MTVTPIVFLGDSLTEAWGQVRADVFRQHGFVSKGIGGETTRQIKMRLTQALESTGGQGLHLLCGINDIAENEGPVTDEAICENIAAMVAEARQFKARVWLASIMPAEVVPWRPDIDPRQRIASLNHWLRAHAEQHGCTFIDYHAVLATETGALRAPYSSDGLHLADEGYLAIEPTMLAALRTDKALADRTASRP